jgi:endonuclease/exonuclease/phosphatase family metal-dependent hydrolase
MRIATWNILSGRRPGEDTVDVAAYAEAVRSLDADLLGLQEVDLRQPRSQGLDLTRIAAEAMGAQAGRFVAALTGLPDDWKPADRLPPGDAPAYGIALLSRHRVTSWRTIHLPPAAYPVPYRWAGSRRLTLVRDEPRRALVADVESPVGPIRVVTTHLSFLPGRNGRQLRLLMRRLGRDPGRDPVPTVLMGDLNMRPARATAITGLRPLAEGSTFPAHAPDRQIDHVLGRGLAGTGGPVQLAVSDHRALVADVQASSS